MTFETLSYVWFYILALVWAIYLIQESFVSGVAMLSLRYSKNKDDYKRVNMLVGTHWDGIQVWLILAAAGMFAAFPRAFAVVLNQMYVPFFLLLYAIMIRGIAIETIYKAEEGRLRTIIKKCWSISSFFLLFILGIYLMNTFMGIPIPENGTFNDSFWSFLALFNQFAVYGALIFIFHSLAVGTCYLQMNAGDEFIAPIKTIGLVSSVLSSIFLSFILIGLNTVMNLFAKGLYQDFPILWILPLGSMLLMICSTIMFWLKKYTLSFISSSISILLFIFSGFTSMFPYIIISTIDSSYGMLITEGATGIKSLKVMLFVVIIFLPLVIGYQLFKYIRFWGDSN